MFARIRKRFKKQRPLSGHASGFLEPLESRLLLSGTLYEVNTLADTPLNGNDNLLTLREAIEAANTNLPLGANIPAGSPTETDIITFNQSALEAEANGTPLTITLNGTQLSILDHLNIQGLGPDILTIDANQQSRIFANGRDIQTQLSGLTITGGALFGGAGISNNGILTIINSTITGNTTNLSGGGIYNAVGTLTLINSTVSDNSGFRGGGIWTRGTLNLINSSLHGNSSDASGGAIYNNKGDITLTNSTIAGNSATGENEGGGGIYSTSSLTTLTITNSIVTMNNGSLDVENIQGPFTNNNSLISTDPNFVRNPSPGPDNIWATPDDDLGDLHLRETSIAINLGNNALAVDTNGIPLTTDRDNNQRITHGQVDIGAYEYQNALPPQFQSPSTLVTTLADTLDTTDAQISLREAIVYSGVLGQDVTFAPNLAGGTMTLGGRELYIYFSSSIDASSVGGMIIDAAGQSRVMSIELMDIEVTLTGLTLTGGSTARSGAGILNLATSLTILNSTVNFNASTGDYPHGGGGIYNGPGTLAIINSTVQGNTSDTNGGGIRNAGTMTLTNSTVKGNSATDGGGGIVSRQNSALTLTNSTVSGNSANSGGGINNNIIFASLTLNNTIVALNNATIDPDISGSFANNSSLIAIDPLFIRNPSPGPDGLYATPDDDLGDLRLQPLSTAIDTGDNTLLPPDTYDLDADNNTTEPLPVDLANNSRIYNNTVDIGAYEAQAFTPGDFNGDESIDISDADLLSLAINTNNQNSIFDISNDGTVNSFDGRVFIQSFVQSFLADFNLDYRVDVTDLSTWATGFGQTNALFSQGDANFDGQVDVADLSAWATNFGNVSTPPAPIATPLTQTSNAISDTFILDTISPTPFITPSTSPTQADRWNNITSLITHDSAESNKRPVHVLDIIKSVARVI